MYLVYNKIDLIAVCIINKHGGMNQNKNNNIRNFKCHIEKINKIANHLLWGPLPRMRMHYEQSLTYHRFTSVAPFIFSMSLTFSYFFYFSPIITSSLSSLALLLSFHLTFSCFNSSFPLIISFLTCYFSSLPSLIPFPVTSSSPLFLSYLIFFNLFLSCFFISLISLLCMTIPFYLFLPTAIDSFDFHACHISHFSFLIVCSFYLIYVHDSSVTILLLPREV